MKKYLKTLFAISCLTLFLVLFSGCHCRSTRPPIGQENQIHLSEKIAENNKTKPDFSHGIDTENQHSITLDLPDSASKRPYNYRSAPILNPDYVIPPYDYDLYIDDLNIDELNNDRTPKSTL